MVYSKSDPKLNTSATFPQRVTETKSHLSESSHKIVDLRKFSGHCNPCFTIPEMHCNRIMT